LEGKRDREGKMKKRIEKPDIYKKKTGQKRKKKNNRKTREKEEDRQNNVNSEVDEK
jgi:hypothetical protein